MDDLERYKIYSSMAEVSRKWVSVMDSKAAFISGLCAALLAFIWGSAKLGDSSGCIEWLTFGSTVLLLISLFIALRVILPKTTLLNAFGKKARYAEGYHPISYFSYVAEAFPAEKQQQFLKMVDSMSGKEIADEALEQHYMICHVVYRKSKDVALAGWIWLISATMVLLAMLLRGFYGI